MLDFDLPLRSIQGATIDKTYSIHLWSKNAPLSAGFLELILKFFRYEMLLSDKFFEHDQIKTVQKTYKIELGTRLVKRCTDKVQLTPRKQYCCFSQKPPKGFDLQNQKGNQHDRQSS